MEYIQHPSNSNYITVKHNEHEINFMISAMINKRNRNIYDAGQFDILNAYIKTKTVLWQDEVYNTIMKCYDNVMLNTSKDVIPSRNRDIVEPVMELFELDDIFSFVKHVYGVVPPPRLAVTFDLRLESDGQGTRVQTYLKDDYLQLVAMIQIVKATLPLIGQYAYIKSNQITNELLEYTLFQFYKINKLFNCEPMVKLLGMIQMLISQSPSTESDSALLVLSKRLSQEDIPVGILAALVIQKLFTATVSNDSDSENIITKLYNYMNNRLKPSGDVSKILRPKIFPSNSGGDDESTGGALLETYRATEDQSAGIKLEVNYSVSTIPLLLSQLNDKQLEYIDVELVEKLHPYMMQMFINRDIDDTQITLLAYIYKTAVCPSMYLHMTIQSIINLMTVGFVYLYKLGYTQLATILISATNNSDELTMNTTVARIRLTEENKQNIYKIFPCTRRVNNDTYVNIVENAINEQAIKISTKNWVTVIPLEVLSELMNSSDIDITNNDIRNILARFLVNNESLVY